MRLYHFTCDHSARAIATSGEVRPTPVTWSRIDEELAKIEMPETGLAGVGPVAWLTDLVRPNQRAVGLTSHSLPCERMGFRFEVDAPDAEPWAVFADRNRANPIWRALLEIQGSQPEHWWIVQEPVPIIQAKVLVKR